MEVDAQEAIFRHNLLGRLEILHEVLVSITCGDTLVDDRDRWFLTLSTSYIGDVIERMQDRLQDEDEQNIL